MKVYVAGPMTGLPEFNYPAFHDAAALLRAVGNEVVNPAEHGDPGRSWEYYMRLGLAGLLECDAIVLLPGWESSRGALLEQTVAAALGFQIIEWGDL